MPNIKISDLQINVPVEAAAPDSTLALDIDPTHPLAPGTYVFQLEVLDNAGNRSRPVQARVVVIDDQAPTAVIDAPPRVSFGRGFTLSGRQSTDTGGGAIARYVWTRLQ